MKKAPSFVKDISFPLPSQPYFFSSTPKTLKNEEQMPRDGLEERDFSEEADFAVWVGEIVSKTPQKFALSPALSVSTK